jgi:hypothetical protein
MAILLMEAVRSEAVKVHGTLFPNHLNQMIEAPLLSHLSLPA